MNLAEWLARRAALSPDSPALMRGAAVVADYSAFARSAAAIGGSLASRFGFAPGDRVAILAANGTEYLEAMYGAWFAGAAVVPINAKLHPREAAWILDDSGARLVFVTRDLGEALSPHLPASGVEMIDIGSAAFDALREGQPLSSPLPRGRDDMAWLFYTSGTTGKPKGVMISNGNIHAMAYAYLADVDAVHATDAALYAAPMSHGAGLYNVQHVLKGARHVVPESGGFIREVSALAAGRPDISIYEATELEAPGL